MVENDMLAIGLYKKMYSIRLFEKKIESLFHEGKIFGTTHGCIGQEGIAVGVIFNIEKNDYVISNHRGHGHYLAYTGDYRGLFAELMGKESGVVGGRGGSQHLHNGRFFSNGIVAGMCPFAAGLALAIKRKKEKSIVVCFIGDGTFGQGTLYESLNLASLFGLPILFIVENNQYAMSTHFSRSLSGKFEDKAKAFAIKCSSSKTGDIFEIMKLAKDAVTFVRNEQKPYMLIFDTYRLCGHSKSDDLCYRTREEEESWKDVDAFHLLERSMDRKDLKNVQAQARKEVEHAYQKALEDKND
jgi:TPP-dependent pyruvate/acetoin dehydrogenase alpha subunit